MNEQSSGLDQLIGEKEFARGQDNLQPMYEKMREAVLSGGFYCKLETSSGKVKQVGVVTKSPEGFLFNAEIKHSWRKEGEIEQEIIQLERTDAKGAVKTMSLVREGRKRWNRGEGNTRGRYVLEAETEWFIDSFLGSRVDPEATAEEFAKKKNEPHSSTFSIAWINAKRK